jgi:glycerol uptake facilitator-like aquaporin
MLRLSTVAAKLSQWSNTPGKTSLLTKALAEFTGCMIFHFLGSESPTPATNATALLVLVYYTARMSGAHLNPALSVTFTLLGYTNPLELLVYWFAQCSGAIMGALWIAALVPDLSIGGDVGDSGFHGCFSRADPSITLLQVVGWEAVCTFCFILPIFSVVWYTQHKSGYGNTGPIIVGFSLYASASAAARWTGGALNPARALASPVVFRCPDTPALVYYVIGEFLGALMVPLAIAPWYGVSASIHGDPDDTDVSGTPVGSDSTGENNTPVHKCGAAAVPQAALAIDVVAEEEDRWQNVRPKQSRLSLENNYVCSAQPCTNLQPTRRTSYVVYRNNSGSPTNSGRLADMSPNVSPHPQHNQDCMQIGERCVVDTGRSV